jgi:flagellar hook-length control protein FliK
MTQGIQFSVLFSSADNMLSIDATAANLSQTSPELQQQAERFRQVLTSEQADGAIRQDFAAVTQDVEYEVIHQATPALPGKDPQLAKAATESAETNILPAESDESSDGTDAAGELLGLIQRANLTASQLQKKAAAAAELHQLVPQLPLDKAEPVEDELSEFAEMAVAVATDKDLTGRNGIKGESHTTLKAVTPALTEFAITPVPGPIVVTDNDTTAPTTNSENAIQGAAKIQTQPVMPVDTLVPEEGLTPEPGAEYSEVDAEAHDGPRNTAVEQRLAGSIVLGIEQSLQVGQSSGIAPESAQTVIAQGSKGTSEPASDAEQLPPPQINLAEKTASGDALTSNSESVVAVSATTNGLTLTFANYESTEVKQIELANHQSEAVLTQVSMTSDAQEQPTHLTKTSTLSSQELAGLEIAGNMMWEDGKTVTDAVSATQATMQADAVARSALSPTDTGTNQESKASRLASQQQSQITNNNDAVKIDTHTQANADERGAEQGTEQRLFQPGRLDVTLATGSSGPSNAQAESFQQQLARFEATVASAAAAQRGAEKTPVPELSARLKQLNLQQQDAAGQLRERVQLMVRQNIQVAEIRLDPAELGQMQIRINLQQEQASVQFIVQQQQAKELLEQQMPRLREMLQQQGIQLGEGQVQQQSRQQQSNGDGSQRQGQTANLPADGFSDDLPAASTVEVQHRERLVDYYA